METITIDGNEYSLSFLDTEETLMSMVALKEQTLPKFIKITTFQPSIGKVVIKRLDDEIAAVGLDDLVQKAKNVSKEWLNVSPSEYALEWLRIHQEGKVSDFDIDIADKFKEIDSTDFWNIGAIQNRSNQFKKSISTELADLKKISAQEEKFKKQYGKYTPVKTTSFIQDSVITEYQLTTDADPLELFNAIELSAQIPYIQLRSLDQVYYKIYKTIIPKKTWIESSGATLTLKIAKSDETQEEFGTVTMNYTTDIEPYNVTMVLESEIGKGMTEEILKNKLLASIKGITFQVIGKQERGIKGVFAVPEFTIARDVFLDLVTNDPMISHYLYVDEVRDLSSQKSVLYLYYSPGEKGIEQQVLTVFLSQRTVSRNDPFFTSKELLLFTPYLNIRVSRANTLQQIERFQHAFALMLDVYQKKFSEITNIYVPYVPNFKEFNKSAVKKAVSQTTRLKALQAQDPELFIYGYPTKCEKKKQPVPIDKTEKKQWTKKGRQIMNYPADSSNYLVCPDDPFPYPGLQINKLPNKDEYRYLPCCYPEDQQKGNKAWNVYLKTIQGSLQEETSKSKSSNIVKSKALAENKLGLLPRNIHYILEQAQLDKELTFYRQGVPMDKNSFIHAVLLALDANYEESEDKSEYVKDFRQNLASLNHAAAVQELYNITDKQLVDDILDENVVFDSKLYIGLLEARFDCQIIVFERTENSPNGEFEIPRYSQGYLYKKLSEKKKTVLIYKHLGIRSDHLETPHYELIVGKSKNQTNWYLEDTPAIKTISEYFRKVYELYLIGLHQYTPHLTPFKNPIGQTIDVYGKCRGLLFDKNVYVSLSPSIPLPTVDILEEIPTERPSFKVAQAFINKHGIKIVQQDVVMGQAVGLLLDSKHYDYVYVPIQATGIISGIKQGSQLGFGSPEAENVIQRTLYNRKVADFLMQFVLYGFSVYYDQVTESAEYQQTSEKWQEEPLATRLMLEKNYIIKQVNEYLKTHLIVDPQHVYDLENLPRRLTLNNSFFQEEKLIVTSEEIENKLKYYLMFIVNKSRGLVLKYKDRTFLDNYYTYANDFTAHKDEMIFIGALSINNWIEAQKRGVSNEIHILAHAFVTEPYFFANWAVNGGNPVIIQNVVDGDLLRALAVCKNYEEQGINTGYNSVPLTDAVEYTGYFFKDRAIETVGTGKYSVFQYAENNFGAILF